MCVKSRAGGVPTFLSESGHAYLNVDLDAWLQKLSSRRHFHEFVGEHPVELEELAGRSLYTKIRDGRAIPCQIHNVESLAV